MIFLQLTASYKSVPGVTFEEVDLWENISFRNRSRDYEMEEGGEWHNKIHSKIEASLEDFEYFEKFCTYKSMEKVYFYSGIRN